MKMRRPILIVVLLLVAGGVALAIWWHSGRLSRMRVRCHTCESNLIYLDALQEQWIMTSGAKHGDPIDPSGPLEFTKAHVMPWCPTGGSNCYSFGQLVGDLPKCSIHGEFNNMHLENGTPKNPGLKKGIEQIAAPLPSEGAPSEGR